MSDELRNLMKGSAENVSVPAEDLDGVVRGGRSLKWRARLSSGAAIIVAVALAWTAMPGATPDPYDSPRIGSTPTATPPAREACSDVAFRATYLPDGWSYVTHEGSGSHRGNAGTAGQPDALVHFTVMDPNPDSPYVDIWQYGDTATLPGDEIGTPVKGVPAGGEIAQLGKVEGRWVVEFHQGGCRYTMVASGVGPVELERVAKELEWADHCDPERVAGPDLGIGVEGAEGRYFGYITTFAIGPNGPGIQFDPAEFLTGREANQAAVAAGAIEEGDVVPNDYFVANQSQRTGGLGVADDVEIWIETIQDGMPGPAPADIPWLTCAFAGRSANDRSHQRSPYWITLEDGQVVMIEEQYLP